MGPVALESKLGWILSGAAETNESVYDEEPSTANIILQETVVGAPVSDDQLLSTVEKFWETESIGIRRLKTKIVKGIM